MPTSPEETRADLTDVELIDEGPFVDTPMEAPSNEPMQRAPVIGTTAAALLAVVAIVAVFAFIARPGLEEDVAVNERAQTTLSPTVTTAPTTSIPGADDPTTTTLRAIPPFQGGPPEELPGVISAFDERGALLVIDRSQAAPQELLVDMVPVEASEARSLLAIGPHTPTGFDGELSVRSHIVEVLGSGDEVVNGVNLGVLAPEGEPPNLLLIEQRASTLGVTMFEPTSDGPIATWTLTRGLDVLGSWGEELLLHRADRVWALAEDGTERLIAEGQLLGFDGRYLVRLSCPAIDACDIIVGRVDEPEIHRVPLPEQFEELAVADWASSIAVSPDGNSLALSVRDGGLSLPTIVDLETGSYRQLGDGMNHRSPVAWSPDGEWLAYIFTDDVMAWKLDVDRSWRVTVNRELKTLAWQ